MRIAASIFVSVFLFISAPALLSGCGGSGSSGPAPSSGTTPGAPAYGALTLAGTGTTVAGTSFSALSRLTIGNGVNTVTQWYNIDLNAGKTYPYVVLIVTQDSAGAVTNVTISNMINATTGSGEWTTSSTPLASEASVTATTVTFTNLVVPGYAAASTTSSLTLNGTLKF